MDQYPEILQDSSMLSLVNDPFIKGEHKERFLNQFYTICNRTLAENQNSIINFTYVRYHSLIFHIDTDFSLNDRINDELIQFFDFHFIHILIKYICQPSFKIILAVSQAQSENLRVYVPGFAIAHDDYIHLYNIIKKSCTEKDFYCKILDVNEARFFSFDTTYKPIRVVQVECGERKISILRLTCDKLNLNCPYEGTKRAEAIQLMSPIPDKTWPVLHYPTKIKLCDHGQFKSYVNHFSYRIVKNNTLKHNGKQSDGSFTFQFLKRHANSLQIYQLSNSCARNWCSIFSSEFRKDSGLFKNINTKIRRHCIHLRNEGNPLKTILTNEKFMLPVFYALCKELKGVRTHRIVNALKELQIPVEDLKHCRYKLPYYILLTFKTILYCAFHTVPQTTNEGNFFKYIGMGWNWIFESTTTVEQMKKYIIYVQETFVPMVRGEKDMYAWSPVNNKWQVINHKDIPEIIKDTFEMMKDFEGYSMLPNILHEYFDKETIWINEIAQDTLKKLSLSEIIISSQLPESHEEMMKLYGTNVPEYLLLNLEDFFLEWTQK